MKWSTKALCILLAFAWSIPLATGKTSKKSKNKAKLKKRLKNVPLFRVKLPKSKATRKFRLKELPKIKPFRPPTLKKKKKPLRPPTRGGDAKRKVLQTELRLKQSKEPKLNIRKRQKSKLTLGKPAAVRGTRLVVYRRSFIRRHRSLKQIARFRGKVTQSSGWRREWVGHVIVLRNGRIQYVSLRLSDKRRLQRAVKEAIKKGIKRLSKPKKRRYRRRRRRKKRTVKATTFQFARKLQRYLEIRKGYEVEIQTLHIRKKK